MKRRIRIKRQDLSLDATTFGVLTARHPGLIIRLMWSRRTFPFWFIGLFIVAILGHSAALFVIWAVLAAGYLISLPLHSRIRCTHCGGTGQKNGWIFRWAFRTCSACAGGRTIRQGARVVGLPHIRQQAEELRAARKNTKTRQRW